jgi:hypothetical protein
MTGANTGITWRSVLVGLALAGALCAMTPYNDFIVGNTFIAGNHFPVGAVAVLLLLSLLNVIAVRARGRSILQAREVIVVYILIMVTSGIPSSGLLRYLLPALTTPYYFAGAGNRWDQVFWEHITPWLGVSDEAAVFWFWDGLPEGGSIPWDSWLPALSRWSLLVGALWLVMLCLSALVRRQWADRERLAFPLVQFPLEVVRPHESRGAAGFFGNRLVWIGAAAIFLLRIVNGLNVYFPALPSIPTAWNLDPGLPDRPWNAASPVWLIVQPTAVAFGYLLTLEVAAGFWASALFMKAQAVALSALGYEGTSAWSGIIAEIGRREQMGGGLVIAGILLWFLRGTLIDAFKKLFGRAPEVDDSAEPLGYRLAMLGLLVGLAAAFLWLLAAGLSAWQAAGFLVGFVCICLVLTRIIAEAGMLMVHLPYSPVDYLLLSGNSAFLGPRTLATLTFVDCAIGFDLRELLMPSLLNGFRLSERSGVSTRRLSPLIAVALVLCLCVGTVGFVVTMYKFGLLQGNQAGLLEYHPRRMFGQLDTRLQNPERLSTAEYVSMAAGGAIVAALAWLRLNFVWWPIHPLGFVMATTWATINLWFSLFLGWFFKLLTIRYTGLRGYAQARALFMGIIMGDILGSVLWIIVGLFSKVGVMVTVI